MKSKEDLDLIASAAAKLALQQLDPAAKKKRQEFTSGLPQAVISLHLKQLLQINKEKIFNELLIGKQEAFIFMRISAQETSKCTKVFRMTKPKKTTPSKVVRNASERKVSSSVTLKQDEENTQDITLNEVKVFSVEVSRIQKELVNRIKLELVLVKEEKDLVTPGQNEIVLCSAELHIYSMIREMYGSKVTSLADVKDQHTFALIQYDFVFRYGMLGYGYSQQLHQKHIPIKNFIKESLLMRVNPPAIRKDGDGFLISSALTKPRFIPYMDKTSDDDDSDYTTYEKTTSKEPANTSLYFKAKRENAEVVDKLIKKRKRLKKLKSEYMEKTTRHDRIAFLRSLVSDTTASSSQPYKPIFDADDSDHPPDSPDEKSFSGMGEVGTADEKKVKAVIEHLSPLHSMARGVSSRARSGVVRERSESLHPNIVVDHDHDRTSDDERSIDNLSIKARFSSVNASRDPDASDTGGQGSSPGKAKQKLMKWMKVFRLAKTLSPEEPVETESGSSVVEATQIQQEKSERRSILPRKLSDYMSNSRLKTEKSATNQAKPKPSNTLAVPHLE